MGAGSWWKVRTAPYHGLGLPEKQHLPQPVLSKRGFQRHVPAAQGPGLRHVDVGLVAVGFQPRHVPGPGVVPPDGDGGPAARGLRDEAIHTAAVALALVECLDRGLWRWPEAPRGMEDNDE